MQLIFCLGICTATFKTSTNYYETTLPSGITFAKVEASTSDKRFERLTRELNIHYRACIGSFIYLLYTRVYFSFEVHKLAKFLSILVKYILRDWCIC